MLDIVKTCSELQDEFINENAPFELNLSAPVRNNCISIIDKIIKSDYEDEQVIRAMLVSVCESIAAGCIVSLRTVFSRFKRSTEFVKLVNSSSEAFLNTIGTHKRDLEMIQLNCNDVERCYITQKDINFALLLLKDYYCWKMIMSDKSK